ncbi:MAG: hypothetical protein ACT4OO_15630 [Nitrospiraceae bacterium]
MKLYAMMGLSLLTAAAFAGCVSKSTHTATLAEMEGAKSELERTRAQKSALEQQVKTLKDLNIKFGTEAQAARDELQRIEHSRDKERSGIETRSQELEQKVKQLSAQNRGVRQEYEEVKRHNETLKSLVARYQKELKERPHSLQPDLPGTSSVTPSPVPTPRSPGLPPLPPSSARPGDLPPTPGAMPAPPQATGSPMNVNKASASDMVLFLGLTRDMADRVVNNRPYRVKGELVAKNVMPKETFDMVKDRITVTP